ncbi:hypothetical protein [Haloarchaeobius litoreus]|uniref:Nucleotide exchange factor GrpE n=1 Tax=Haloarchaeobius litoreus TaxID=755306 RepID=A0ABD6DKV9_9EURY|nr:hypothetical protein [Haloarchaeobius litoreus]
MSRNAQPDLSTAQLGEEPSDASDADRARTAPDRTRTDPTALRAQVAVLERDLAAREAQVSAMREQYETVLAAHDENEDRELRTDGGQSLADRIRRALSL